MAGTAARQRLYLRLPPVVHQQLTEVAARMGVSKMVAFEILVRKLALKKGLISTETDEQALKDERELCGDD